MIPLQAQAIGALVIAAAGFGAGWQVQSWRWDASLRADAEARVQAGNDARERERHLANVQATIAETLEKDKANALRKKDRVIADLRAGAFGLRDAVPVPAAGSPANTAGNCDAGTPAHVLRPFLEAVAALTAEADDVAVQLAACQAIIRADRGG